MESVLDKYKKNLGFLTLSINYIIPFLYNFDPTTSQISFPNVFELQITVFGLTIIMELIASILDLNPKHKSSFNLNGEESLTR